MPENADTGKIEANYENGVLELKIPRTEKIEKKEGNKSKVKWQNKMASNVDEKADTLYWTTLSLEQLRLYRQNNGQIPQLSFNIWENEEISTGGHEHLDDLLGNTQSAAPNLYPLQWSGSHILVSVEEPHTYFKRDPFSEGSLENTHPIPFHHLVVELVGQKVSYDALAGLKLSRRVEDYYKIPPTIEVQAK